MKNRFSAFSLSAIALCWFVLSAHAEDPVPAASEKAIEVSTGTAKTKASEAEEPPTDQAVAEIQFVGNTLNKSKALERKIKTRRNQPLERKKLQEDVKILYETGDFDDVTVEVVDLNKRNPKGKRLVRVIFTVAERPIIKRIDYKGNRKIRPSSFEDKVKSQESMPYDRFKAELDERAVLEYYRDQGYAKAMVEHYTTLDAKNKKLILTFFITEGERVLVKDIRIHGTKRFSEKTIRKRMKTRVKKVFKDEVLQEDLTRILDFYKNRGHLDVAVSSPTIRIDESVNQAFIELAVSEGPPFRIGEFTFAGHTIFSEKELRKALVAKPGQQFKQSRLEESIGNISSLYADKGYLRTEVDAEPRRDAEKGVVSFDVDIKESSVVYVDGIYVDGNTYTKEFVIRREVLLKPGDVFAAGRMRRSVEKIYNLGFLDDVQVDIQQPRDPNLADLIFTVKEGKPGVFSAGAGFSSIDRFVGTLQLQHTNLFGRAQRADVSYEFGARRQNFEIGWTDPWFLGYRMSGGVDLFNTLLRRDALGVRNAYREKRRGLSLRLGPRLSDDFALLFAYTIQNTEFVDVEQSVKSDVFSSIGISREEALRRSEASILKSSFLSELALDTRDNRFDASRGSRNSISVELAGGPFGGDLNFYKPQVSTAWYFPTFWKFVFTVSGRMAWANRFSPSKDVPFSERFFLGGPDTIRGYDTNSIAPKSFEKNAFGGINIKQTPGRILALFNAEYKFPIVQERNRTIFQGAFFVDVGGSWLRTRDIEFTTGSLDNQMKAGAGFGFRIKTPVFPIRLDFGIPLNPRPEDERSLQPYFTIGNIF